MLTEEESRKRKREADRRYYERNKDKVRERKKSYREQNTEKVREGERRYYERNKDNEEFIQRKREADRRYYEQNKEKVREREKIYCEQNKEKIKERKLLNNFGLSLDEYNEIHEKQNGACAICGKPETLEHKKGKTKNLAVDHCHSTGKVRGLLCHFCNTGIGFLNDDITVLISAIEYLLKHKTLEN